VFHNLITKFFSKGKSYENMLSYKVARVFGSSFVDYGAGRRVRLIT
jgi:hypothetical protein